MLRRTLETNETEHCPLRAGEELGGAGSAASVLGTAVRCEGRVGAEDLEQGTWLVVLRADTIPHVVMLQAGQCYSLEHDGNRRYPARKLWRLVEGKRLAALFCELGEWARGPVAPVYAAHACIEGDADCFLPVRDYCAAHLAACATCEFPWQLVPLLSIEKKLLRAVPLNLAPDPHGELMLPTYSRADIRARIAAVRAGRRETGPPRA